MTEHEYRKMSYLKPPLIELNFGHQCLDISQGMLVIVFSKRLLDRDAYVRRFILIFLIIVTLISVGGCAPTTKPVSPEHRMHFGRVGVVALASTPRVEFHTFAKGWAAGAAKGGSLGIVEGLLGALIELQHNPPSGQFAGIMTLMTLVIGAAISTTVYGVGGGLEAVPVKTARQIEHDLSAAIGDLNLVRDLAEKIYTVSASRPELHPYAMTHLSLPAPGASLTYHDLNQQGIDTVVEVQLTEAGFRGGSGAQPKVRFYMNARIKLSETESGVEIYSKDFQYQSRERSFTNWFTDGSKELVADFQQAMATLAERIVDELFLVTNFPFDSGIWAVPGQPEFGSCWFYPIYPKVKYTSLWYSIRKNAPGIQLLYPEVDSLQPLLRWEPFPRPRDQKPSNASLLSKISDVTYDLKIWEAQSDFPERLVYDIGGLYEPQFRPAFLLQPKTMYFWTFRARYKMAGQSQVTRWAFSNIPSNVPSDYPQRPPGGICDLEAIPSTNYFRFTTP